MHFIRLELRQGEKVVSDNFYLARRGGGELPAPCARCRRPKIDAATTASAQRRSLADDHDAAQRVDDAGADGAAEGGAGEVGRSHPAGDFIATATWR